MDKRTYITELVERYRKDWDDGEPLDSVMYDIVADLLHYADTIPEDEREWEITGNLADWVIGQAELHYSEERDEAIEAGYAHHWDHMAERGW